MTHLHFFRQPSRCSLFYRIRNIYCLQHLSSRVICYASKDNILQYLQFQSITMKFIPDLPYLQLLSLTMRNMATIILKTVTYLSSLLYVTNLHSPPPCFHPPHPSTLQHPSWGCCRPIQMFLYVSNTASLTAFHLFQSILNYGCNKPVISIPRLLWGQLETDVNSLNAYTFNLLSQILKLSLLSMKNISKTAYFQASYGRTLLKFPYPDHTIKNNTIKNTLVPPS